jgi:flagellar motor switch protein FliN
MIKKRNLGLETAAELFLTAFNGKTFDHGALERMASDDTRLDVQARWFRQNFTGPVNFELYVGVSPEVASALPGELTELLKNVFRTMARALGTAAGTVLACEAFTEDVAPVGLDNISYELRRESTLLGTVLLSVPESTLSFLSSVIHSSGGDPHSGALGSMHMEALMDVDLPVSISFGTTEMSLADVLRLTTGSIVEFNHLLNEPVNVVVNDCLVARGDVVVVDGNYGVRISEVLSHPQR